ncbi:MAG TPA: type II toxin-antitoxin system VapC family toxin [Rhodocyclaceae bacterium]|nr:type II toxin-antitoxin system VapC family toxin [Rhodocyclaceae bacterium]
MYYLDTAVFLSAHYAEPTSKPISAWLRKQIEPLATSAWALTECASASGIRVRRGDISATLAITVLDSIRQLITESCILLPVQQKDYLQAASWLADFQLGLRAGDALHLAIVERNDAMLVSYDMVLLRAAKALGVATVNPLKSAK